MSVCIQYGIKNTSIRVLLTIFPPRDYLHSVRRLKSSGDSPVSFNFKDRKSDSLVKFLFNSFAHIVYTQAQAATLDNLFSPRTGTEIPYVPLQHNMQFSPMFPYVPLQILYFPYKYCIFVWKIHCRAAKFGWFKPCRLFAHLVQKNFFWR
jgi:hypothetical protein